MQIAVHILESLEKKSVLTALECLKLIKTLIIYNLKCRLCNIFEHIFMSINLSYL